MPAVDRLMRAAVAEGVFPGAVLLVDRGGELAAHAAYGVADRASGRPVTVETVFDLASLTKPLATTLALMRLEQEGRIRIDQRLGELLPDFAAGGKGTITIDQLLSHTAGLPDYRPYYSDLASHPPAERRARLQERLIAEPLASPPGERMLYSDLDFMILGWVVEAVCGRRLDRFVAEGVYAPLGAAESLFFIDLERPLFPGRRFAATEQCPWRGRLIAAEVHDENAHALGGVAGHAGLFGTAAGIRRVLAEVLRTYHGEPAGGVFDRRTVRRFLQRVPGTDKCLGFDMPAPDHPSCGRLFPPTAVGHLGFTGTSFWLDLERRILVVLLTNRVHPTRANIAIRAFRPVLHDAVMQALGVGR
jgi:serine-type D-Ala-D-Ala carboxypeptidase